MRIFYLYVPLTLKALGSLIEIMNSLYGLVALGVFLAWGYRDYSILALGTGNSLLNFFLFVAPTMITYTSYFL